MWNITFASPPVGAGDGSKESTHTGSRPASLPDSPTFSTWGSPLLFSPAHAAARPSIAKALPDGGLYQLHIGLGRVVTIEVGRLGRFRFPCGRYIYTGSAQRALHARIARHLRASKTLRWHIDYLLRAARVRQVAVYPHATDECALHRATQAAPGAVIIAPGFGASDCRCPSHLVYLGSAALTHGTSRRASEWKRHRTTVQPSQGR